MSERNKNTPSQSETDGDLTSAVKDLDTIANSLNIKFEQLEKRISDSKTYMGWGLGTVGLLISTITIVSGFKYSNEIDRLNEFKKETEIRIENKIDDFIGQSKDESKLIFLSVDNADIDQNPIPAKINDDSIEFYLSIKNSGQNLAEITLLKFYTKEDIPLMEANRGSDVEDFSYSRAYESDDIHIKKIPADASVQYRFRSQFASRETIEQMKGNKSSVMVRVYYGDDKMAEKKVQILLEN